MHSPETQAFKRMRSELDGALARIALAERNNEQLMGVVLANQVAQAEKEKKQAADEQMALDTIFSAIHNLEEILLQVRIWLSECGSVLTVHSSLVREIL